MHGRYGHETVTIQNLNVVTIFPEQNLILIKGAIPGPEGSLVVIKTSFKKANQFETFNIITKEIQKTIESLNLSFEDKDFAKVVNDEVEKEQIIEETKKEIEKEENK
jgi:large subunit ribosomal protein L3